MGIIEKFKTNLKNEDFKFFAVILPGTVSVFSTVFGLVMVAVREGLKQERVRHAEYQSRMELWSFGGDSPIRIKATPEEAADYNRHVKNRINTRQRFGGIQTVHSDGCPEPLMTEETRCDQSGHTPASSVVESVGRRISDAYLRLDPEVIEETDIEGYLHRVNS